MNENRHENQGRIEQPEPFTPGMTRTMVCEHAFALYRDKLRHNQSLTLEDWVLAEKDLVSSSDAENMPR